MKKWHVMYKNYYFVVNENNTRVLLDLAVCMHVFSILLVKMATSIFETTCCSQNNKKFSSFILLQYIDMEQTTHTTTSSDVPVYTFKNILPIALQSQISNTCRMCGIDSGESFMPSFVKGRCPTFIHNSCYIKSKTCVDCGDIGNIVCYRSNYGALCAKCFHMQPK